MQTKDYPTKGFPAYPNAKGTKPVKAKKKQAE
jgi:hypothetical protein